MRWLHAGLRGHSGPRVFGQPAAKRARFRAAGEGGRRDPSRILDNSGSVSAHMRTCLETGEGFPVRSKVYNRVVSNFEAGEIREPFGGYLADYADYPNAHMRATFLHPKVLERGCSLIEVSL